MGEAESGALKLDFNARLRLEFRVAWLISNAWRTVFQMAEVAVPEGLFVKILARMRDLAAVPT